MSTSAALNDFVTDLVLARPNTCPNCGPFPCYRICPNHPECYTLEDEIRAEDYGCDHYLDEAGYRYEEVDPYECDEPFIDPDPTLVDIPFDPPAPPEPNDGDDIPF